jgi:flagellar biosynthetic protein FliQ
MSTELAVQIISQAFWIVFWLCAPLLILGFISSVIVNLVQIFTSLQDSAFSTVPRLGVFLAGFIFFLPWMLQKIMSYTTALLGDLSRYAH